MPLTKPASSRSRTVYKFECPSHNNNCSNNSNSGKMAAEARTISQRGHIHNQRQVMILPHILFLAITVVSLQFDSVSAQSMMTKNEPMFISRSETFKFITGETIVLPCEVANTDTYVVAWKRGIAILTAGSVKVTPDPRVRLVNGFNLQIRDALPTDAGDYICQIATMDPREITHTVEILVPPRIHHISTGGHLQVKKGSSVRIECSATGNPMPNVTWSRKNNILPNGEEKLHSHVLSIENVDRHKGGVYICTANNRVGQPASSQVVLHVLFSPEISVERPVVFSGEGHEATLVCIVHGETQPEVIWFKDTMQLDTTERHIMETRGSRHTLIIRKVHPQDFGNYSCVAENQLGKARKTLQLSGKPNVAVFNSPPISQYKDRYNISWAVDSHSPIEEYKLSFRKLPQGHEVVGNAIDSPSSSSHSSSSSISSSSQMYGSGSGLHAHRIGSNMNGFSGQPGSGTYSGYGNVMHWGHSDWRNVVLPAVPVSHHYVQGMSYMVRGLDPDQHYEATVQSRNRYGWSDLTNSFVFSTSSNDGLVDPSTYLNLSDNEMRDLSVTFYGSSAINRQKLGLLALSSATLALSLLVA
ncbi:obscurin isoform X1 [Drosophila elegans]|uniref:obscurin isoform X1 n=1 Tax=Drosophila elegans TaxID=30023 RepID=UPI0007E8194C|nr:obscurin isoform X1 [Drosophila elegans]